ncbi:SPOSA6832_03082, partial [Sporobolomyces salmonicolor]
MPAATLDVDPEGHHHHHHHTPHRDMALASAADADRLADFGYEQELKRGWSVLESFGISFSIISVITGVTTQLCSIFNRERRKPEFGLTNGGPGVMSVGWICVSAFTMFVALAMAEIRDPDLRRFAAYSTGYFNALGQAAVTTGIVYGCASLIATLGALHGFEVTAARTVGIHAGLLVFGGIINTFGIRFLGILNRTSVVLHSLGVFALAVAVVAKAPTHRTAKEVFATFNDATGDPGWSPWDQTHDSFQPSSILLTQYTITGFDASAHMSEETTNAQRSAPLGVIMSVGASAIFGFFLLLCLLFSIQDFDNTIDSPVGQPVLQIFVDIFGTTGATVAFTLIILCVVLCGTFSLTSNSRMYYSAARDHLFPKFFAVVDGRSATPVRTGALIWLAVLFAFILALPALGSSVAFTAVTSIATVGLYVSYAIPIVFRLLEHERFLAIRGPFYLGRSSRPVALVASLYVGFITVVFCLPTMNPVDSQTLNYTPIAVGIVLVYISVSWFAWARKTFTGPRQTALDEVAHEPGMDAKGLATLEKSVTGSDSEREKEKSQGTAGLKEVEV